MSVGIAEINAVAAARPMRAALDRDAGLLEAIFPNVPLVVGNRKGHVNRPVPVMRRNGAAGKMHGLQRMATQEQQQHAAMTDIVSAQPRIAINAVKPEHLFVERTGAFECLDVKHRFENAEQRRHRAVPFLDPAVSAGIGARGNDRNYPATGTISCSGAITSRFTALAATTARC